MTRVFGSLGPASIRSAHLHPLRQSPEFFYECALHPLLSRGASILAMVLVLWLTHYFLSAFHRPSRFHVHSTTHFNAFNVLVEPCAFDVEPSTDTSHLPA
jgi:hypothetical protein